MNMSKAKKESFNPFNFVIFGGDGDLALRKIYPALFHRLYDGQITEEFKIFAVCRRERSLDDFLKSVLDFIHESGKEYSSSPHAQVFLSKIELVQVPDYTPKSYSNLSQALNPYKKAPTIFYFSTPSSAFGPISSALRENGLINNQSKVVLEKPLGNSLATAIDINRQVAESFQENQVYRIDHYLGKETVQNLMVLRFANHLFEHAWNSQHIENVQITVAESLGVQSRAGYYDQSGALLDMVQNHLLQLLCLVAMEPPHLLEADFVRNEKLKVLYALRPFTKKNIKTHSVKGQYTRGKIAGASVSSYLEDIEKFDSKTETFVALTSFVDNWRWKGVPFYLRTGKRMPKRYSEIVINFRPVAHNIFPSGEEIPANKLIIRLQPEERIELVQMTKIPGPGGYRYKPIALKLDFVDNFKERFPEAYERLIMDVVRGNQTLFMRQDELEASWNWIESITKSWKDVQMPVVLYEAGTWGPGQAVMLEDHVWNTKGYAVD